MLASQQHMPDIEKSLEILRKADPAPDIKALKGISDRLLIWFDMLPSGSQFACKGKMSVWEGSGKSASWYQKFFLECVSVV